MQVDQHYFRGFVLTEQPITGQEIKTLKIGSYVLLHSPDLPVTEYKGERHLILLGYAVMEDISLSTRDILKMLDTNPTDQQALLNRMNGRYILLVEEDDLKVYPDATTLRPVFYHESLPIAASHSGLAAYVAKHHYEAAVAQYDGMINGYLDFSRYHHIYKLNPNTYLSLHNQQTTRFFPSEDYEVMETTTILQDTIRHFTAMRDWLRTQDTYLTITAGIDSRVSLAVMHDKTLPLLTYNSTAKLSAFAEQAYANDIRIVSDIISDLGLNHTLLQIDANQYISDETMDYARQFESFHSYSLSEKLAASDFRGKVHIKSTIFELAKLPVVPRYYVPDDFSFKEVIKRKKPEALTIDADEMIESYFRRADLTVAKARGHYLPDLYYQEQRMGNWHSNITQETDNSVEVFILLNTREMLRRVTSASLSDRRRKVLHREWINHFWPVLNFYPVNEQENLYTLYKEQQGSVEIEGDDVIIAGDQVVPKFPLKKTEVTFNLRNKGTEPCAVNIMSHYKNAAAVGTLSLQIADQCYPYQALTTGKSLVVEPDGVVSVTIKYNKLYDRESWQKAARLTIN
ncbi:hypothetical protein [Macrococcus bovicus]|uniref:hypothetical protein n=1 Tax=Macrococcus bovicus TaxID=69968 RepID=UPI0025A6845F|nr:hypothetical protein [Macrococcus bovicus]WJP98476.1 hypothetical protein QSV55_04000 [Macrococcus bovicus]